MHTLYQVPEQTYFFGVPPIPIKRIRGITAEKVELGLYQHSRNKLYFAGRYNDLTVARFEASIYDAIENFAYISDFGVNKSCQKIGIGSKLLINGMGYLRKMGITQIGLNASESAIKFYENMGFYHDKNLNRSISQTPGLYVEREI